MIVLKPINEGSSLALNCKNKKKLIQSTSHLLKRYNELLLEYIGGQEVQVAVINGIPLGAIELIPKDYFTITRLSIQRG